MEDSELKRHFEENMLDGDKVEDCGKAMLSAQSVWEYISARHPSVSEADREKFYDLLMHLLYSTRADKILEWKIPEEAYGIEDISEFIGEITDEIMKRFSQPVSEATLKPISRDEIFKLFEKNGFKYGGDLPIGHAVNLICQTFGQPALKPLDETEVRRVMDNAQPTSFDGMQISPTYGMAKAVCQEFGQPAKKEGLETITKMLLWTKLSQHHPLFEEVLEEIKSLYSCLGKEAK